MRSARNPQGNAVSFITPRTGGVDSQGLLIGMQNHSDQFERQTTPSHRGGGR
jgi:hypothetical protein